MQAIPQTFMVEVEWNATEYANHMELLPNGDSAIVFQYTFQSNSCPCTGPITPWEAYTVSVDIDRFCNGQLLYNTAAIQIEDPPVAQFETTSPECHTKLVEFINNTVLVWVLSRILWPVQNLLLEAKL